MKFLFLVWKGLVRKKVRTGLTLLSIFIAFLMFVLLSALSDWLGGRLVEGSFSERLVVQSAYSLPLPLSYYEKIKAIEGVVAEEVAYNSFLGAYYQDSKQQFYQMATNADVFMPMHRRYYALTSEQEQAWLRDKMGVIVGSELADQYGWKVGDRIPLISPVHVRADNGPWEFNIRGIFEAKSKGMQPDFLVLHFDYMAEGRGGNYDVYWYELNVKDPLQIDKVAKRIDAEFRNTSRPTSTRTMAALSVQFSSQFGKFGMIASLILSAVLFTMLLVTGNTMMQAFRERIHEFAVLRSLGFSSMALLYLILAESIIMVIIGGLPGIGLVWIAQDFLQPWFTGLYVRPVVVLQALGLMLIMGLLVGLIPAVSAKRLTIVDALRRRQ